MNPSDIARTYDAVASHWAGDAFNAQNGIAQHERALQFLEHEGGPALDVGCGSSGRFMRLLRERGFQVEGLDISSEMLRLAREKFPGAVFHHADICDWDAPKRYAFITAWDSIWHVPLADQEAVYANLFGALAPGGVMIFTTGGVDGPDEVHNPLMGEPCYHAALGIPAVLRSIEAGGCVCRHLEFDQPPNNHLYVIVQRNTD